MPSTQPPCLFPTEPEIGRLVLGRDRARAWPGLAVVLERRGLPTIDPEFGGRYWPAVQAFFDRDQQTKPASPTQVGSPEPVLIRRRLGASGLKRMKRKNGRVDLYWVADEKLVRAGYRPKTVRLRNTASADEIASRCGILQAEMLEWASGRPASRNAAAVDTLECVCRSFEMDVGSPIHGLRQDTQRFYARYLGIVIAKAGKAKLADISGSDLRRWHGEWASEVGPRSAYACVQTLRRAVGYGCELRNADAIELAAALSRTEISAPKARKRRPNYDQVVALRKAAHEAGRPSIALAVCLQFELGLRQKDVIGEWVRPAKADRALINGAITDGSSIWDWGLTWSHIDADLILSKPTSKSNGAEISEHDLRQFADIMGELPPRGVGPVILDERSGLPWKKAHFSRTFRKIARTAGWPDDVWNMDSRAGAVSEAFEAGAEPADVMRSATHTQMKTTMLYNRGGLIQSGRVADLRLKDRIRRATGSPANV